MSKITQIRGALLEEAVLYLLQKVGYETIDASTLKNRPIQGLQSGHSGLEVRGRGTWHQLDAFALWKHSPAFMYPLYLIVEAKCYSSRHPVELGVTRNLVGVHKDISENYFTLSKGKHSFQAPRYNYSAAIFSTSGFSKGAIEYALAHQVFLIQYKNVPAIQPLIDAIFQFDETCITDPKQNSIAAIRQYYRVTLSGEGFGMAAFPSALTDRGAFLLNWPIASSCRAIQGSYFGMLQGRWPLHLLQLNPLPESAFKRDTVQCRIYGKDNGKWRFVPLSTERGDMDWFELEFSLPPLIASLVAKNWENPIAVAGLKQEYFSYIDLSGIIGGVRRNVRLELNQDWIKEYIESKKRSNQ